MQFYDLDEPRVVFSEGLHGVVQGEHVDVRFGSLNRQVVEGDVRELAATFEGGVPAGVLHQDPPHGAGGCTQEVRAAFPGSRVVKESKPRLVDQGGGLKRVAGPFAPQKATRQEPKLAVKQLNQVVVGSLHRNAPEKKFDPYDRFSQAAAHEGLEARTMQTVETNGMNAMAQAGDRQGNSGMKRMMILMYGVVAYMAFFVTICYAIGFIGNYLVPKSIDTGEMGNIETAVLMNAAMLALFAIQHTIMARPAFKKWVTQYIPREVERSTFVITASLILAGTFYYWRPIPVVLWSVENPVAVMLLHCAYFLGWGLVFGSSFLINHFDLFGLRQVVLAAMKKPYTQIPFRMTILYKFVRHPLMLGFMIAVWSSPVMTLGHFLFSGLITSYIFMGIQFEERDLEREHGEKYRAYKDNVPMLLPYKGAVKEETIVAPAVAMR